MDLQTILTFCLAFFVFAASPGPARAPRVFSDALRTLYHFESAHNPFRKSIPIFGVMR
jgi:hypothetical protein